jgi:hypothetical protein
MKKKAVIVLVVVLISAGIARAQILALPVFDASNYLNAVLRLAELEKQLEQMVMTYEQLVREYEQMVWMAKQLPGLLRYRFAPTPWVFSRSGNTYGTTGGWTSAINSGAAVAAGYRQAVERLLTYGPALGRLQAEQAERARIHYGTVELADAGTLHSMQVIGLQRDKTDLTAREIQELEDASLSNDPELNTEIAVMNKINAASVMTLRSGQDTNQLLVALLEHEISSSKSRRDAEATAVNADIAFRMNAYDAAIEGVRGTTDAITSFRMP